MYIFITVLEKNPWLTPSGLDLTTHPSKSPQLDSEGKDSFHMAILEEKEVPELQINFPSFNGSKEGTKTAEVCIADEASHLGQGSDLTGN